MALQDTILSLTKQLYPKGRAFWMPKDGFFEKMHVGLAVSQARAYQDALSTLDSILPDNDNFTEEDATQWERRLGLVSNPDVALSDRKLAITQKIAHPGFIYGRQHYLFLQRELRAAGFDVYVFENRFPDYPSGYKTMTPEEVTGGAFFNFQYGDIEYGELEYNTVVYPIIANSIDEEVDKSFNLGNFRSSFFICGPVVGDYAEIPLARKLEFRQLVLRVKSAHMAAIVFVNYT